MASNSAKDTQKLDALIAGAEKFSLERLLPMAAVGTHAFSCLLGARLGLYEALDESSDGSGGGGSSSSTEAADGVPADRRAFTAAELAKKTGLQERLVLEWLCTQAVIGVLKLDPRSHRTDKHGVEDRAALRFWLPEEHALVLSRRDSPLFNHGVFAIVQAMYEGMAETEKSFRQERPPVSYAEQPASCHYACEQIFGTQYRGFLATEWIPAVKNEALKRKLEGGKRDGDDAPQIADLGVGHGVSSIVLAQAYPHARVHAFDIDGVLVERARDIARREKAGDNLSFSVASNKEFPPPSSSKGGKYDLVVIGDAFHDCGDPVGIAKHVRSLLHKDGSLVMVEPKGVDYVKDAIGSEHAAGVGMFLSCSTLMCVPSSLSQEVGLALGACAGPKRTIEVVREGGFRSCEVVAEGPTNLVYEARP